MDIEVWKLIPSSPIYEVSNLGRVRHGSRILHIRNNGHGYLRTTLGTSRPTAYIHHIVAEAFIGPRPPGFEIDHKDCNRANNRLENLQYLTITQNRRRTVDAGRNYVPTIKARGENQGASKLTPGKVRAIRRTVKQGKSMHVTAKEFGISVTTVFKVFHRITWAHVE